MDPASYAHLTLITGIAGDAWEVAAEKIAAELGSRWVRS